MKYSLSLIPYPWNGEDTIRYYYDGEELWVNGKLVGAGPWGNTLYPDTADTAGRDDVITLALREWSDMNALKRFPDVKLVAVYYTPHMRFTSIPYQIDSISVIPKDIDIYIVTEDIQNAALANLAHMNLVNLKHLRISPEMSSLHMLRLWDHYIRWFDYVPIRLPRHGLESLRRLDIFTLIHGDLRGLRALKNLRELRLAGRGIDDRDVEHIQNPRNLRLLNITRTNISPKAVWELKQSLPDCRITYENMR